MRNGGRELNGEKQNAGGIVISSLLEGKLMVEGERDEIHGKH